MNKTIMVYFTADTLEMTGFDRNMHLSDFVKATIGYENSKIENRGFVTLNEVLEDLGMMRKFEYIPYGFNTKVDIQYDKEHDRGRIIAKKLYSDYPTSEEDFNLSMNVMEGK